MSADQLLACDEKSQGCNGGNHDTAWRYIAEKGIVTGGDYGSNEVRPFFTFQTQTITHKNFH